MKYFVDYLSDQVVEETDDLTYIPGGRFIDIDMDEVATDFRLREKIEEGLKKKKEEGMDLEKVSQADYFFGEYCNRSDTENVVEHLGFEDILDYKKSIENLDLRVIEALSKAVMDEFVKMIDYRAEEIYDIVD